MKKTVLSFARKTLTLTVPVVAVFALVLGITGIALYDYGERLLGEPQSRQIEVEAALIASRLEEAASDMRFLAHSHTMNTWLNNPTFDQLELLGFDFLHLVRDKDLLLQVRLLGINGDELIRAEVDAAERAFLRPVQDLQNKAGRTYFGLAMELPHGALHVSRFDLNMENGLVERPFRPTVRLSMPLFDDENIRRGVLVFNLRGAAILDWLSEISGQEGWQFLVTNDQGYWLKGPAPDQEWGFMLPQRASENMGNAYPDAWESISWSESGRIATEEGLFIFTSILPSRAMLGMRSPHRGSAELSGVESGDTRWVLVAHLPPGELARHTASLGSPLFISFGVGSIIIILFSLLLVRVHERLVKAKNHEENQSKELVESVMKMGELVKANRRVISQLHEANAKLESVLHAATQVAVIATDPHGTITMFNAGAENLLGYPAKEMIGLHTPEAFHLPEEVKERGQELTEALGREVAGFEVFVESARQGGFESREWTFVRKDGSRLDMELVVTPIRSGMTTTGYLGIAVDVTQRNKALRQLEYNRARLDGIVSAAVDGIFTMDTRGFITTANKAGAALFGYAPEEIVGRKVNMLMDEPHRTEHDRYLEKYLTSGEPSVINVGGREVPGCRRDGSIFALELAVSEVRTETQHFFTGIMRDITERKKAEKALMQANKALVEKQRILDEDMAAAAQIQLSLLPNKAPTARGFSMDWLFLPSNHVGGDVFNILPLPGGRIGLYLIDVSGHGPAAAMVTVSVSQIMQPGSEFVQDERGHLEPDEVLRRVDRAIPLDRFDRFCTMFYMIFDPAVRTIVSSGAGHPPPILARPGHPPIPLSAGGTVIGLGEPVPFVSQRTEVRKGDVLLLYTDGCTEHANSAGQQFGHTRLENVLTASLHLEPDAILEQLRLELERFGEGAEPEDDISLICIKFNDD
ncbi:PAS domain S-box protein [Pseudodesulfovibrio sp. F-1]|uniref:Sensor protein FixL n=1 Tax=Pseudodesulfovibrio alkaliphilus TaxID=2661613 RepID=A0A7K1KR97_9BACT|nr:PAS domain S-box protein [Pseudodesulfovibrio alkaliphilus]MUM78490.1 PAS domain S-box protein [Pseudodesulfovibrio alkaliphilus]